jgi:hypothetical protein
LTLSGRIFKFASMSITLVPIWLFALLFVQRGSRGRRLSDGLEPGAIEAT